MHTDSHFSIMSAPLQGLTEAEFRLSHSRLFPLAGQPMRYFTPFVRIEKGEPRRRDIRDASAALSDSPDVTPQIICRDLTEFNLLTDALTRNGHSRINLNLGCPFPPQTRRGRGAGLLAAPDRLREIADAMLAHPDIRFSIKMRLGIDDPRQWTGVIDIINAMPLEFVCIHPRTASQLYRGELLLDSFAEILPEINHPVIYNGDILTPADIDRVRATYPSLAGVMIGRGLLTRPSLAAEWQEGSEWTAAKRRTMALRLHDEILALYTERLSGDTQILSKIKPFWDYLGGGFDRKAVKKIIKAGSMANYLSAVAALSASISV